MVTGPIPFVVAFMLPFRVQCTQFWWQSTPCSVNTSDKSAYYVGGQNRHQPPATARTASTTIACSLPLLTTTPLLAGEFAAAAEVEIAAVDVGDFTPGFRDEDGAGGMVPDFPDSRVGWAGGDRA